MALEQTYLELLSLFAKWRVRYLVVWGQAVIWYTEPRYTKDLDVWIDRTPANARRVHRALAKSGAPMSELPAESFTEPGMVLQIGVRVRIDVLTDIKGVKFETAWKRRRTVQMEGSRIQLISKRDLVRSKKAAGRLQDLLDLEYLEGRN
ncbi:MAG TPA: hypothetical protein VLY24_08215 [Bryobacteraceae bacterium]|nr:hypothetical protein [Bryobacteraceae bacterium]